MRRSINGSCSPIRTCSCRLIISSDCWRVGGPTAGSSARLRSARDRQISGPASNAPTSIRFKRRWQYVADALGIGFAQGKTMLWRRDILENRGGIRALGSELAEDAAATKVIRSRGLRVRLVDTPFEQPLGRRSLREVWSRQVRWARLRRSDLPALLRAGNFHRRAFADARRRLCGTRITASIVRSSSRSSPRSGICRKFY